MPDGGPGAKRLGDILKKWHKTNPDVVTDMIHPTVPSVLALDMIQNPEGYSVYANDMFKHVRDLVTTFKLYLIGECVSAAGKKLPMNWMVSPEEDLKEREEMMLEEIVDDFNNIFEEVDFLQRVEVLAETFEHTVLISLALGFCPCLMKRNEDMSTAVRRVSSQNYDDTTRVIDNYLNVIEYGMRNITFLSINEILTDLIVTDQQGLKTATLISRPTLGVVPLNFKKFLSATSFETNFLDYMLKNNGGSLTQMIQYEIQLSYARNESKKYLLERMRKTQLVVGTDVSSQANTVLGNVMKQELENSSTANLIKSIEDNEKSEQAMSKIQDKRHLLEKKSAELQHRLEEMIKVKDDKLTSKVLSLASKNRKIEISKSNQKTLDQYERKSAEIASLRSQQGESEVKDPNVDSTFGLYQPGSKHGKKETDILSKAKQDIDLKKERDLIKQQYKIEVLTSTVLQQSLNDEVLRNEALHKKQTELELQVKTHEEKEKVLTRIIDEREKMIKGLSTQLDKTSEYISRAAESLQLSHKERERVMSLIKTVRSNSDFLTSSEKNDIFVNELVNFFGSFNTVNQEKLDLMTKQNRSRVVYDQVLSQHCVRPLPVFSRVQDERQLTVVNEWFEFPWMKDRPVRDAMIEQSTTDEGEQPEGSKQNIIDTKELYVLDINPIPNEVEDKIRHEMSDNLELSAHMPALQKKFMSVQFKGVGNIKEYLEHATRESWTSFTTAIFHIGRDRVTAVGQKKEAMITSKTMNVFITPFLRLFTGLNRLNTRLSTNSVKSLELSDEPSSDPDHFIKLLLQPLVKSRLGRSKRMARPTYSFVPGFQVFHRM